MENLNRKNVANAKIYPEKIIQFGEGNFLRAFTDWIVFKMNNTLNFNSGIVVVQPLENGTCKMLNDQDGLYHVNLQGMQQNEMINSVDLIDVITRCVNPYKEFDDFMKLASNPDIRFVFSNTTEAGIVFDSNCKLEDRPAKTYPGKLTQLLYERFKIFEGAQDKGFIIFPCELIFHNGQELRNTIIKYSHLWELGKDFEKWFSEACGIYSTLVDRIVPGFPKNNLDQLLERIDIDDKLIVNGEVFHQWVIEAPSSVEKEFPASAAGLNVLFVNDEKPYHELKVTILNGAHTALSPVGYLAGLNTVRETMENEITGKFIQQILFEELPCNLNLPKIKIDKFTQETIERFRNPYINHFLTSIMLNSFQKFKTRDLPSLKKYYEMNNVLPMGIVIGLAAIISYYRGGKRGDDSITLSDDIKIIEKLQDLWQLDNLYSVAEGVLSYEYIWGENLNDIGDLTNQITAILNSINNVGMAETLKKYIL